MTPEYALSLGFLVVDHLKKDNITFAMDFPWGAGDGPSKKKSRDDLGCVSPREEGTYCNNNTKYGVPSPEEHAVPRLFKTRDTLFRCQAFFFGGGGSRMSW